ncbi:MAG: hypothetical protein ABW098_08375 [Candidatus Thiodiazotropha sp.]
MPLGEIAGGLIGGTLRLIGQFFAEVVLEIAIKGLGYLLCRKFSRSIDPDGILVLVVGVLAWAAIILCLFVSYDWVKEYLEVDSCLDSGGQFNYENKECIFK